MMPVSSPSSTVRFLRLRGRPRRGLGRTGGHHDEAVWAVGGKVKEAAEHLEADTATADVQNDLHLPLTTFLVRNR